MRFILMAATLICVTGIANPAQASRLDSCDIVEGLLALPTDIELVRAGRGDARQFKRNLAQSLSVLKDRRRVAVFSKAEIRTLRIFAGAVREDWKLNGTSANGRQIPGLTRTSKTIQSQLSAIVEKFGCIPHGSNAGSSLWSTGSAPIKPFTLLFVVVGMVLVLLGAYWLVRSRYSAQRKICRLPALIRYDGICTATTMLDISRGGTMIEAPAEAFPTNEVTLHLPGLSIPSRVAWTNKNFAGLKFVKNLSARRVDSIANLKLDSDQPVDLTDEAPSCFEPGCHLLCKTHRMTMQLLQVNVA